MRLGSGRAGRAGWEVSIGAAGRECGVIGALLERTPWLDLRTYADLCTDSDDALDAVIAARTSRAAALSKTSTPDEGHLLQQARREGWIVLPEAPLESLVAPFHAEANAS
jgi:hypothetical protein